MTRLVLLHGFAGSSGTFAEVCSALGDTFAPEAPALLGHGAARTATSFEAEIDRLADVLSTGAPPLLLGYSFGGRLAMGLVARHPARWRGAVFIGAHPGLHDPGEREARRRADLYWADLLRTGDLARFGEAWEAQPIFASQARLTAERQARQREARSRLDPQALARAMEILGTGAMPCWDDALVAARLPMVFIAGGLDAKYVAIGAGLVARASTMRLIVVPGVGHNVTLEAPEAVAAAVRTFAEQSAA